MPDQVGVAKYRAGLGVVGRHAGRFERGERGRLAAQPDPQHRLACAGTRALRQHPRHRAGGIRGGGQRGRHVHHQHRIVLAVRQQRFQRLRIARRIGVADDVHRIGARPGRRQHAVEATHRGLVQRGQGTAEVDQPVHRQHADAAAIGQDRQPPAGRAAQVAEGLGGGEELVQGQHPQQAGAAERGVVDRVRAGQGAGMGGGRPRTLGVAAGLDHHHRLGARGRARGGHELARVADRFDVEQDRAGLRVLGEPVQQVAEIHVQRVAQRNHGREADRARHTPFHQPRGDRARLRHQRQVALERAARGEAGVEPDMRGHHPQAVGPDHAQAVRARRLAQALEQGTRPLPEAGGDHHRGTGAGGHRLGDHPGHRVRRRGHDHQLRLERQVRQARHRGQTVDLPVLRVDQAHRTGEAGLAQVAHHRPADRALARAGADHGDRLGAEDRVQGVGTHAADAPCLRRATIPRPAPLPHPRTI